MELYRPKIDIPLTKTDKALEATSLLLLLLLIGFAVREYATLPGIIPTHFNTAGVVDGYGSKTSIFAMPGVGLFIYSLLTIVNQYPHRFNYIREITPENARLQYSRMTQLLRWMKVGVLMVLFIILYTMANAAKAHSVPVNALLFAVIASIVATPVFIAFYAGKPDRKQP